MNRGGVSLAWVVVAVVIVGATISSLYIFDFGGDEGTLDENEVSSDENEDLYLSDYPEVFSEDSLVVVGDNASPVVEESAERIAKNLENLTGNRPEIKESNEVTDLLRSNHNLVVFGTPKENRFLENLNKVTSTTEVTENYPGDGEGFLEILRNPWNREKAILLIEGSKQCGVMAAARKLVGLEELEASLAVAPSVLKTVEGRIEKGRLGISTLWFIVTNQGEMYMLKGVEPKTLIKKEEGTKARLTGFIKENINVTIPTAEGSYTIKQKAFIVSEFREVK